MLITTKVVSSNPVHWEVYSIQHYVIKFVSDLRQVGGFLWVLWFPPPEILLKVALSTINQLTLWKMKASVWLFTESCNISRFHEEKKLVWSFSLNNMAFNVSETCWLNSKLKVFKTRSIVIVCFAKMHILLVWVCIQGGPKVGLHLVGMHFTFFKNI